MYAQKVESLANLLKSSAEHCLKSCWHNSESLSDKNESSVSAAEGECIINCILVCLENCPSNVTVPPGPYITINLRKAGKIKVV